MSSSGVSRRCWLIGGSRVLGAGMLGARSSLAVGANTDSPVAETTAGKVVGRRSLGVSAFKGIPYAASTAAANRFRPPQPPPPWAGIRHSLEYGPAAPQRPAGARPRPLYRPEPVHPPQDEDCLRLNVWTPATDVGRRPVLVWWHGGGFEAGSGSSIRYDGTSLCLRGDVVVVTVNHRLNVFGHCYLAGHLGEDFAASGNAGFLDLVASLRWVRDNIERFGGDPGRVLVFGQSGGGRKVSLALAAETAAGLFHRAVVQSGSHLRIQTPDQAAGLTDRLLHELGIVPAQAARLRDVPMPLLEAAQLKVSAAANLRFAPVMDDVVFDRHPWDPAAPAVSKEVPIIVGTTRTELSNQLGHDESVYALDHGQLRDRLEHYLDAEDIDSVIAAFRAANPNADPTELFFLITTERGYARDATLQLERRVAQGGAPAYCYWLTWHTPVQGGRRYSPHSLCVPLVFDNATHGGIVGPPGDQAQPVATAMSSSWIAFAHQGDPNNPAVPRWAPYDLTRRPTMVFDDPSRLEDDPRRAQRLAMDGYPTQQQRGARALHRTE